MLRGVLGDTICAVASPPGSGARAVLRLSGPDAFAAAAVVFRPAPARRRAQLDGHVAPFDGPVAALLLAMPAPHSYTGEDVVELHVPGSPLLCAELQRAMAAAVATVRPARPGEFTARACRNGRMDGMQAEGVLLLIHGEDAAATARGAAWLAGGLSAAVARARALLQDALAMLELGLDFEAGETGAVPSPAYSEPLAEAQRALADLQAELPHGARGGEVLLLGRSNAGKSSLCNALAGRDAVLVDGAPGTTRDLLRVDLGEGAAVWDAPGDLDEPRAWDARALQLRDRLGAQAAAGLLVVDPQGVGALAPAPVPLLAVAFTKADRFASPADFARACAGARARLALPATLPQFATSARTGAGIGELRAFLCQQSRGGARDLGGALRPALDLAVAAAARAAAALADGLGAELASVDLQSALQALGEIDGSHGVDDLLERIYARFCLGK